MLLRIILLCIVLMLPCVSPAMAVPMTLHEAVQRAQATHPSVAQAKLDIARAQAQLQQFKAAILPSVAAVGQWTQLDSDRISGGHVVLPASQLYAAVALTVPVLVPQRWVAWRHAQDAENVAEMSVAAARWDVGVAAARLWLSLLTTQRQVEVLERAQETAKVHLGFAEQRRKGGIGNQLDIVRAAQEVAQADALVKAYGALRVKLAEQLAFLTDASPPVTPVGDCPLALEATLATDASLRPDVRAVERRIQAALRVVNDSTADWYPSVFATVLPFAQWPALSTVPNLGLQAQLIVNFPIFDWGARRGLEQERQAIAEQLQVQKTGLERQIAADARAARGAWMAATSALQAARDALGWAQEGLNLAQIAWRAGASTNLEVVDAERRTRDAATAVVVAEDAVRQAWLDASVAGGGLP